MTGTKIFFYIGSAGFAGALARYYISGWVYALFGSRLPFGTLAVNVAGSLLLGFLYTLSVERTLLSPELRLALTVGFLGSFTTFSTFSLETFNLFNEGSLYLSVMNIAANLLLGLAAVVCGIFLARLL